MGGMGAGRQKCPPGLELSGGRRGGGGEGVGRGTQEREKEGTTMGLKKKKKRLIYPN